MFDFDGVLVDTFEICLSGVRRLEPKLTAAEYRKRFEGNINEVNRDLQTVSKPDATKDFFAYYTPRLMDQPFHPGIEEVIPDLALKYSLMIISSTISSPIYEYLEAHGMAEYFDEILGNDVDESKMAKIQMITTKYGVAPTDCIFITDTLGDLLEAADAEVDSLVVAWGFHDRATLAKGSPAGFIGTPEDISESIDRYFE